MGVAQEVPEEVPVVGIALTNLIAQESGCLLYRRPTRAAGAVPGCARCRLPGVVPEMTVTRLPFLCHHPVCAVPAGPARPCSSRAAQPLPRRADVAAGRSGARRTGCTLHSCVAGSRADLVAPAPACGPACARWAAQRQSPALVVFGQGGAAAAALIFYTGRFATANLRQQVSRGLAYLPRLTASRPVRVYKPVYRSGSLPCADPRPPHSHSG